MSPALRSLAASGVTADAIDAIDDPVRAEGMLDLKGCARRVGDRSRLAGDPFAQAHG